MEIRTVVGRQELAHWIEDWQERPATTRLNNNSSQHSRQLDSHLVSADLAQSPSYLSESSKECVEKAFRQSGPQKGKRRLLCVTFTLLTIVMLGGALWMRDYRAYGVYLQSTDDAVVRADAVTISSRIGGYAMDVLVSDDEDVKPGQPLVRIDPRDYQRQVLKAKAQAAQMAAVTDAAQASIGEQYAAIDEARTKLVAARTQAKIDAEEVARYRPLADSGAETRSALAQLQKVAAKSVADLISATAALIMREHQLENFKAQLQEGKAQTDGANAQLALAKSDVSATVLRAPIAGRIGARSLTVGDYVQSGTRLMSIIPLAKLYVVANFKETQLALMRPGQPVSVRVDALEGVVLRGQVTSIAPGTGSQFALIAPENATGNFTKITQRVPVRIAIEPTRATRNLLIPGLSVTVTVNTIGAGDGLRQRTSFQRLSKTIAS